MSESATVEAFRTNDPLFSPNPNDPNDAKLLLQAARHTETMTEPVLVPKKFMSSTWHQNTSIWKLLTESKDPFKVLLYDLMYRGPLPKKEGKLPVVSIWEQREFTFQTSQHRPSLPSTPLILI